MTSQVVGINWYIYGGPWSSNMTIETILLYPSRPKMDQISQNFYHLIFDIFGCHQKIFGLNWFLWVNIILLGAKIASISNFGLLDPYFHTSMKLVNLALFNPTLATKGHHKCTNGGQQLGQSKFRELVGSLVDKMGKNAKLKGD